MTDKEEDTLFSFWKREIIPFYLLSLLQLKTLQTCWRLSLMRIMPDATHDGICPFDIRFRIEVSKIEDEFFLED